MVTLKEYLEATSTPRSTFAEAIGVSAEAVRRYCDCGRIPTPEVMRKITLATACEVTANDFFGIGKKAA